jgi:hypothetical protein
MLESVGPLGYVIRKLNQVRESGDTSQSRLEVIEIIEALILALVAVATAWSGYQAAEWAGKRAELYAKANRLRVTAEGLATLAGQERIYDSDTFNSWLAAKLGGKEKEAEFFERRFRDEYRPAFTAWLKTDPFNNPQASPGPIFMPDYHNAKHEQFLALGKEAADVADQGTKSGETGDQYVRIHSAPCHRALNYGYRTALSFQVRSRRVYDSCLPVALPAVLAIAAAAPHLNIRH